MKVSTGAKDAGGECGQYSSNDAQRASTGGPLRAHARCGETWHERRPFGAVHGK